MFFCAEKRLSTFICKTFVFTEQYNPILGYHPLTRKCLFMFGNWQTHRKTNIKKAITVEVHILEMKVIHSTSVSFFERSKHTLSTCLFSQHGTKCFRLTTNIYK